jgi:hypothetical protein
MYDFERSYPTFAGILFFGKNPRFFLSGAYIQLTFLGSFKLINPLQELIYMASSLSVRTSGCCTIKFFVSIIHDVICQVAVF